MFDRQRIIEGMSPTELSDYRRIGGVLPPNLEAIADAYERGELRRRTVKQPKPDPKQLPEAA